MLVESHEEYCQGADEPSSEEAVSRSHKLKRNNRDDDPGDHETHVQTGEQVLPIDGSRDIVCLVNRRKHGDDQARSKQ